MIGDKQSGNIIFSLILVFRNEQKHLQACLDSLDNQTFPRENWEIILVDSNSVDGSREIAEEYMKRNDNCALLYNPAKLATSGWNLGIQMSSGRYYYPVSGHSITHQDYLLEAIEFLKKRPDVHALGGRVINVGTDKLSKAIAAACNTAFAMGGVYYRIATAPKQVNVVGLGLYSRELYDSIGPYDSTIARSGDWEFNYRAWSRQFKMYINPAMKTWLYVRSSYKAVFIQQFRTGYWKVRVWAMHPRSLLPRHAIPAVFVLWLLTIPVALIIGTKTLLIDSIPMFLYSAGVIHGTLKAVRERVKWYLVVPGFLAIHLGYGIGFLAGLIKWRKLLISRKFP